MITSAIYFCVKLGLLQLYPAYICYKAIKVNNQQEFKSLLTFWIVSITYLAVEYFSDIFLFWFPFYTQIKLVIVLWLILPQTQGTSVFYTRYLDPFLHSHEKHIDNALLEIQAKVKETVVLYGKHMIEAIKKMITDTVFKGGHGDDETTRSLAAEQASAAPPPPPPEPIHDGTGSYIINPYSLFSTLIATANRYQQQNQHDTPQNADESEPVKPLTSSSSTVSVAAADAATPSTATTTPPLSAAVTNDAAQSKLDRNDSHDSLHSFVNVKDNSTSTSPELPQSASATWGGYLSSWVRKPSSSGDINKKQD